MAVTTEKSTQETARTATPPTKMAGHEYNGQMRVFRFNFTQGAAAGDANSLANLVTLPGGRYRLLKRLSNLNCSAFGAARTLDIGYLAHTKQDGTAVSASVDTIADGLDVSALATLACGNAANALTADPDILFDSKEGVTIQAKVLGDTIPVGATLKGEFVVVPE